MFLVRTRPVALTITSLVVALALSACGSGEDPEAETSESSTTSSGATPLEPTENAPESIDPNEQEGQPVDPEEYDDVVAGAIADLAERESAEAESVTVLADAAVQWSSGALGCASPGQTYTQAITPGRRIILELDGRQYAYHAGESGPAAYCANPEEPATE